jgi:hypothetical protein
MKKIIVAICIITASLHSFAQGTNEDAAKVVLKQYKDAVEKLDVTGTEKLFTTDSQIFESGGSEGNYAHYLE